MGRDIHSQDWLTWRFQYDFQIENQGPTDYRCDSIEVSLNEDFSSTRSRLQNSYLAFDDSTSTYSIVHDYGCVSCGFNDMHYPPSFFITVHIFDRFPKQNYAIMIPVTFDRIKEPSLFQKKDTTTQQSIPFGPVYFNLQNIDFENFIYLNSSSHPLTGVRVDSDGQVHYYTENDSPFPQPQKLIKVKKS